MTAFEITIICLFGFVALLFLLFSVAAIGVCMRLSHVLKHVKHKLCDCHREHRPCREVEEGGVEEEGVRHFLDVAAELVSLAMAGVGMWRHYRRGKR